MEPNDLGVRVGESRFPDTLRDHLSRRPTVLGDNATQALAELWVQLRAQSMVREFDVSTWPVVMAGFSASGVGAFAAQEVKVRNPIQATKAETDCLCDCIKEHLDPKKDTNGNVSVTADCGKLKAFGDCARKCLKKSKKGRMLCGDLLVNITVHVDGDTGEASSQDGESDINIAVGANATKDGQNGGDATATSDKKGGAAVAVGGKGGGSSSTGQSPGTGGDANATAKGGNAASHGGDGGDSASGEPTTMKTNTGKFNVVSPHKKAGQGGKGTSKSKDGDGASAACGGKGGTSEAVLIPGGDGGDADAKSDMGPADAKGGDGGNGKQTGGAGGDATANRSGKGDTATGSKPKTGDPRGGSGASNRE